MSMGSGDWVEDVVRKAVQKEMGEDPQSIAMTTTRLTSRRAFPVTASLRMPDGREVEVSICGPPGCEKDLQREAMKLLRSQ